MPCHPARARELLNAGKAAVYRRFPFTMTPPYPSPCLKAGVSRADSMTPILPTISVPLRTEADGTIYIGQTKIMLELVISAFRLGDSPEHICENYSVLSLSDVYVIYAYYLQNRESVDLYMKTQEQSEEQFMQQIDERYPLPDTLRAKIRAFQNANSHS